MKNLFADLVQFSRLQLASQDVDPLYPVLKALHQDMEPEIALWHTFLYVGYYNIASATYAFQHAPRPMPIPEKLAKLSTGVERRGFRNGSITRHIASLLAIREQHGSLERFLVQGFGSDSCQNWQHLQQTLQTPWGNGRWAAYKTGEILQKVHGFPIVPTDMGHAFSSGPRWGLTLFYGKVEGSTSQAVATLDAQSEDLLQRMTSAGVKMGIEQLETMLCDFHALHDGRYYVGHDIDMLQEQLLSSPLPQKVLLPIWQARVDRLPHAYLGELGGWQGVDVPRKKAYQQTGKVVDRAA